jgi:alpha-mannosidase
MRIPPLFAALMVIASMGTAQPLHLYIANDDHTDYFWTADDEAYREAFINQLDYYIGLMEAENDTLPEPYQHRYNCDNLLWVYEYEKAKSPADFQRLVDKIRSGHISVPFNNLVPLYGAQTAEIAIRSMYYGGYLERRYGLDLDLAVMMENQTMPLGIASLWGGAGAKYSWKGVCACSTPDLDYHDRRHEVYHARGRDGKGVMMKWYDLINNKHLGGYAECRFPNDAIEDLTLKCMTTKYPYTVAGAFGYGWDDFENYIDFFPDRARARSDAGRQVFVSNEIDFFEDFIARHGDDLPVETVTTGNDWDLLVATMAQVSGDVRRAAEKLRAAEAMATLVALQDTAFGQDLAAMRELAWISLGKYYDHDWTNDGQASFGRAQFQRDMAADFIGYIDTLYTRSQKRLGRMIDADGTNNRFYVFNPLGWTRTDIADIPFDSLSPIFIVDLSTGEEVPSEFIRKQGVQHLRILASDIPSAGYKVYQVLDGMPIGRPNAAELSFGTAFDSDRYRVGFSLYGIDRLLDKADGQDYVIGSLLNATNGVGSGSGNGFLENTGPVSTTVFAWTPEPYSQTKRITLYAGIDRIDIENVIDENPGNATITFDFPFNTLSSSSVWHEEVGAVILAKPDDLGGHYSTRNARYDWQAAGHFVHVGNEDHGITVSSLGPHFFKLGESSIETLDHESSTLRFLAAGKVAYGNLGIHDQDGDDYFTYQISLIPNAGAFDQAASMRSSLEHQNPFVTGLVKGSGPYPPDPFSLLRIDEPDVLLWSLKPAEEGINHGIIARMWNQADSSALHVRAALPITAALATSHVETDIALVSLADGALSDHIGTQEMRTFRLFLADTVTTAVGQTITNIVNTLTITPNPAKERISIRLPERIESDLIVRVSTLSGTRMYSETWPVDDVDVLQVDVAGYPPGVYVVEVVGKTGRYVGRFVKE